jgi:hypothetical protein
MYGVNVEKRWVAMNNGAKEGWELNENTQWLSADIQF